MPASGRRPLPMNHGDVARGTHVKAVTDRTLRVSASTWTQTLISEASPGLAGLSEARTGEFEEALEWGATPTPGLVAPARAPGTHTHSRRPCAGDPLLRRQPARKRSQKPVAKRLSRKKALQAFSMSSKAPGGQPSPDHGNV